MLDQYRHCSTYLINKIGAATLTTCRDELFSISASHSQTVNTQLRFGPRLRTSHHYGRVGAEDKIMG